MSAAPWMSIWGKINRAAAMIPQEARQKKIRDYVDANSELRTLYEEDAELTRVIDTAIELQGMTRHASTHAAGVIVADRPLVDYLPLHRITGKDPSGGALKAVTQFPMETAELIGLLKIDFLGLVDAYYHAQSLRTDLASSWYQLQHGQYPLSP